MYIIPLKGQAKVSSHMARNVGGAYHQGIDLVTGGDQTVIAAAEGKVSSADFDPDGYGHYLIIRHPNDEYTLYGHMAGPPLVSPPSKVRQGQEIGIMGRSGNASGVHVHFEIVKPPNPGNFWSSEPRWLYKKNPFLEIQQFQTEGFGGAAAQQVQFERWIKAIVDGPARPKSREAVIEAMTNSGVLPSPMGAPITPTA